MRILFLSRWFPYPPDNGSKIRIFNILKQLSRQHEVSLLTFYESSDRVNEHSLGVLKEICVDVQAFPYQPFRPSSFKALLGFLSREPRYLVDTYSAAMASAVEENVRMGGVGLVVVSQLGMVPYARHVGGLPALLEELELTSFIDSVKRGKTPQQRARSLLTWLKLVAYLRRVLPRFAGCTVVSELEKECVRKTVPGYDAVQVIPNAIDISCYEGYFGAPQPDTLVFSGALTYTANYDALSYFLKDIYPLILQTVPNATLRVTGRTDGVDLASLPNYSGVQYMGYVDDIRPVVAQSWVSVVPLRVGGGTRLKILESMALGTPVVSTSKGVEGLEVTDGDNVLIADSPNEFSAKVVALLRLKELRSRLAAGGRRLVEARYDWRTIGDDLCELVERAAGMEHLACKSTVTVS
jgi:glycosyltransferase involved in cell wall biosynthesis